MRNTILLVEDDINIAKITKDILEKNKYKVINARDGGEAITLFKVNEEEIDLILLDIMLPKKNGDEVLKEIRKTSDVPVAMFSNINHCDFQERFVKLKIDDYIVKPCTETLLIMKIKRIIRENSNKSLRAVNYSNGVWEYRDLNVDFHKKVIYKNGTRVLLGKTGMELLEYFVCNQGYVVTREQIIDAIWGIDGYINSRTIDSHISKLRNTLSLSCIKTVPGLGYTLEVY